MKSGDITFEVVSFSDSQKLINLLSTFYEGHDPDVKIISRFSWEDLQLIICATKALRNVGFKNIHLYVPYFLGARSDRRFEGGQVNYLKDVICPIINTLNYESVTVMDPHSTCLEMGLNGFKKMTNEDILHFAICDAYKTKLDKIEDYAITSKVLLVGPDKGSTTRTEEMAKLFDVGHIVCDKHRNIRTGKIERIDVGNVVDFEGSDLWIVDDICDGGRTFIELAQKLKQLNPGKMYLVVTHGIFSMGYNVLLDLFDGIYCTNSVKDVFANKSWVFLAGKSKMARIKQLNVLK